ncbi:MAG: hypothetical protein ACOYY2_05365 [Actinomycetota bacterium]
MSEPRGERPSAGRVAGGLPRRPARPGRPDEPPPRRPRVAGQRRRPDERPADTASGRPDEPAPSARPGVGPAVGRWAGPAPVAGPPGQRVPWGWLVWTLLALTVVLSGAAGFAGYQVWQERRVDGARTAALAAARTAAPVVLSYDYRWLDQDFAAARNLLTGAFRDQYDKTTADVVRPTATQYQAVVKAQVVEASVVAASRDRVVTLLFVNQTTTSTRLQGPRLDISRVRLTLVRSGDRWLVSAIDAL